MNRDYIKKVMEIYDTNKNAFISSPKLYIISPPRTCSTLLSIIMNLHPSISMYYESNLNRWFLHQKPQPQNIYNYSSLPRNVINNVYFEYKNKRLSFEKVHTIMTATNDCLRESMHSNKIIGDKQPLFQFDAGNDLPYVEYLASLPNSHFIILYRRDFKKYIDSVINWVRGDFPKKREILPEVKSRLSSFSSIPLRLLKSIEIISDRPCYVCSIEQLFESFEYHINNMYQLVDVNNIWTFEAKKYPDGYTKQLNELLHKKFLNFSMLKGKYHHAKSLTKIDNKRLTVYKHENMINQLLSNHQDIHEINELYNEHILRLNQYVKP